MTDIIACRYRVLSELGRGNMGAVYRVADTLEGDREVALKVIQATGPITPELRLLFREEFRAMTRLRHPNTIEVLGYGQLDETAQYLTMEVVAGRELSEVIGGRPMPLDQVYPLLIQLLQALDFIHSRRYVHHDIKAQNIRVQDDGRLKLMDFGLMCRLGLPSRGGRVTGTPGYMPPEVVRGGMLNGATDLYAVGCLAYEMLTGRLPFEGRVIEVVRAHVNEAPAPLRSRRSEVPERLERLVMKLLEKEQNRRYQQASEVIADLAALAGLSVTRQNLEQQKSYLVSSTLVGRDAEIAQLEGLLGAALDAQSRAVMVGAPAGVGKSRLVQELLLQAKLAGAQVLVGPSLETGMAPYEAIAQALRPLLSLTLPEEADAFGPAIAKLFPAVWANRQAGAKAVAPGEDRARFNDMVVAWLQAVSERTPLVLFLDDVHWTDHPSLEVFNHCVRQLGAHRVLLVGSFRNDETPIGSPVWYTIEEGSAGYLKLDLIGIEQGKALVTSMLREVRITPACADYLCASAAGNPFYLTETLRYLMEEGVLVQRDGVWHFPDEVDNLELPSSVDAAVLRRLRHLGGEATRLARVAAALGRHLPLGMLHEVSGLGEDELFQCLDELIERQFVLKDGDHYTFPHDRVREVLYGDIAPEERAELHRRCGDYMERQHADALTHVLPELAYHFGRSGDRLKAFDYLQRAGHQANAAGATATALALWMQADEVLSTLAHPDKAKLQAGLWWCIGQVGFNLLPLASVRAFQRLKEHLEAYPLPDAVEHRLSALQVGFYLGGSYGFAGQPLKGLAEVERVERLLPPGETPLHGALLIARCSSLFTAGRWDELTDVAKRGAVLLIDQDLQGQPDVVFTTRVGAASYQNATCFQGIRPDDRLRDYAIWAAEAINAPSLLHTARHWEGVWYAYTGRYEGAQNFIEMSNQASRRLGAAPSPLALYLRPYLLWQRGEYEEALWLSQQALAYPHLDQYHFNKYLILGLQGLALLGLERVDEADAIFRDVEARSREADLLFALLQALLGKGHAALLRGDLGAARRALEEAQAMAADGPSRNPLHQAVSLRLLAEVACREGRPIRAQQLLERAMAIVERPEQDNLIEQAHLHRAFGEVAAARSDQKAAAVSFRRAGELFQRLKNAFWLHRVNQSLEGLLTQPARAPVAESAMPEARFEMLKGLLLQ